jgi:hypothetical protein
LENHALILRRGGSSRGGLVDPRMGSGNRREVRFVAWVGVCRLHEPKIERADNDHKMPGIAQIKSLDLGDMPGFEAFDDSGR